MLAASCPRRWIALASTLILAGLMPPPALAVVELPGNITLERVDFERHLMGVFGRMGCNSGGCHGSFQGKGGFRLSLFGYDPEKDYAALTREVFGRRVNAVDPDRSLILLKATGQVEHGGGPRFAKGSWQYHLMREWLASGARWQKGKGEVAEIKVIPSEQAFQKPGEVARLRVLARFADGSEEEITPFCDFRVNDDAVAEMLPLGQVKSLRPGDTALVVSYRGNVLSVRVMVPVEAAPGFRYPEVPAVNYIDHAVSAKLRKLNIVPSELADDAQFLRRVTIDSIGCLPAPDEVRAFLADKSPDKRAKKIDELLNHPMHAALWATKFSDITGNNTDLLEVPVPLRPKRSQMWHDWFRKRVAQNMPYDEIARGVLCATSRDGLEPEEWLKQVKAIDEAALSGFDTIYSERPSLDLFWRRQQNNVPIEQWGEKTAAAFMGIRLECAQCHKHPFDRWTQADYRAYANIFGSVAVGISPEARKAIEAENAERRRNAVRNRQLGQIREVHIGARVQALTHPDTNKALPAKALGGPEIAVGNGQDPRVQLFDYLRSPDHPFFAHSFVNRVWGHYFGIGLVEPVDDFSLANPPSNPELLAALAKDFVDHRFDIRHIERTILQSRTYQLSWATNPTNRLDRSNFSHSYVRRMMAEVVVDVLNSALGVTESFGNDVRPGSRAIEVGPSRVQNVNLGHVFRVFGRPPRAAACDCERAMEPALPQTLYLMTEPSLLAKLQNGRLNELLKAQKTDEEVLEELFLATLTRFPTEAEKQHFAGYRANRQDRQAVFVDTLWALINTREFILNH
jgi:hypothetical protein